VYHKGGDSGVDQGELFSRLRELLDVKEEQYEVVDGTRVMDIFTQRVPERYPEVSISWMDHLFVTVSGEMTLNRDATPILRDYVALVNAEPRSLEYRLKDGDGIGPSFHLAPQDVLGQLRASYAYTDAIFLRPTSSDKIPRHQPSRPPSALRTVDNLLL
jgi:molybdopterin converting factor small subunit